MKLLESSLIGAPINHKSAHIETNSINMIALIVLVIAFLTVRFIGKKFLS